MGMVDPGTLGEQLPLEQGLKPEQGGRFPPGFVASVSNFH